MKPFLSFLVAAFLLAANINAQNADKKTTLDDRTYSIHLKMTEGKKGNWQWVNDELVFSDGKLKAQFMNKKERFSPSDVVVSGSSEISFESTMHNPGGSEIKWNGTIKGNTIFGTAVWTNLSGTHSYSFKGTAK